MFTFMLVVFEPTLVKKLMPFRSIRLVFILPKKVMVIFGNDCSPDIIRGPPCGHSTIAMYCDFAYILLCSSKINARDTHFCILDINRIRMRNFDLITEQPNIDPKQFQMDAK